MTITLDQFWSLFGRVDATARDGKYADRHDRQILCALSRAFRPQTVLEIGVNEGRTAELLLRTSPWIRSYVGLDVPHDYVPAMPTQKPEVPALGAAGQFAAHDPRFVCHLLSYGTCDLDPSWIGGPFNFVFIDADHSYEGVKRDTELACSVLCAAGGIIAWHDYHHELPGVVRYLNELEAVKHRIIHIAETRIAFSLFP